MAHRYSQLIGSPGFEVKMLVRVLTHRCECHFYALTASGSMEADEFTCVDDCPSGRPTGTLTPVGLKGVPAAAGT